MRENITDNQTVATTPHLLNYFTNILLTFDLEIPINGDHRQSDYLQLKNV